MRFESSLADKCMDEDCFGLTDAVGAVGGLVFDGGIPPAIVMEDVICAGEVEASAAGFDGEQEDRGAIGALKAGDHFVAFFHGDFAVEERDLEAEF